MKILRIDFRGPLQVINGTSRPINGQQFIYQAAAVRTLTYYLEDEANEVNEEQMSYVYKDLGGETNPVNFKRTW